MADLTTRNRTKDTLISDRSIYSQMLCQLSYGEPEGMNLTTQITVYKSEKLSESAFKCERMPLHAIRPKIARTVECEPSHTADVIQGDWSAFHRARGKKACTCSTTAPLWFGLYRLGSPRWMGSGLTVQNLTHIHCQLRTMDACS